MRQERRVYPRAKINWPVEIKTDRGSMEGLTSNVTPNGVFIHCQKPLKLNVVFDMDINIPNSDQPISARAEVVWSNRWGPDDGEARKFIARAALSYLKSNKIAPELFQTLQTLIIDISKEESKVA